MKTFRFNIHGLVETKADSLRRIGVLPFRAPAIPNARCDQHGRAHAGEQDQKRRRQHEPSDDRCRSRESAAHIAIKCAGPCALCAALENHLHGPVGAHECYRTIVRTNHARRGWRLNAVAAQRTSAIRADGHGLGAVLGAFHSLRYVTGSARKISNSPCRSTSPVISSGSATMSSTRLFTGLPSAETSNR